MTAHRGAVTALAVSSDAAYIISGGADTAVALTDIQTQNMSTSDFADTSKR